MKNLCGYSVTVPSVHLQDFCRWNVTPEEARRIQLELAGKVKREPALVFQNVRTIAGLDVSCTKDDPMLTAGIVVCDAKTLEILETTEAQIPATFPYIPGLLSFRETPALLEALKKLRTEPDVLLIDGHGLAHPRRFGIACHIGLILDKPTIGCAKSLLVGKPACPAKPDLSAEARRAKGEGRSGEPQPGAVTPLFDGGEEIGSVVRTREGTTPVYISIGHKIDLPSAIEMILHCCRGYHVKPVSRSAACTGHVAYRLPEPARLAHLHVNAVRKGEQIPRRSLFSVY